MKIVYKILFALINFTLFFVVVNAATASEEYTYSCDYRFSNGEGKYINYRIKATNLHGNFLSIGGYENKLTIYILSEDNMYEPINGCVGNGKYYNSPDKNGKLCILTEGYDKINYLKESFSSGTPQCPRMYLRNSYDKGFSLTVSSQLDNEGGTEANTIGLNCYEEGSNDSKRCNEVKPVIINDSDNNLSNNNNNSGGMIDISEEEMTCSELLGPNLTAIIKVLITAMRIIGMIIVIVNSALSLVPAINNPDKLNSAKSKLISMGIVLVLVVLFPTLLRLIGNIFGYDLSCIA